MSQETVDLTYSGHDAVNRRDLDGLLALMDPEVEFSSRLLEVEGGVSYRGHDGIRRWWEDLHGVFPDFRSEVDQVQDLGGEVTVARLHQYAQGIESDAPAEQTIWQVTRWRDKRAISVRIFLSEADALEAAGLSD